MDNRIKRLRFAMICWYVAAAGFYVAAALKFIFGKEDAIFSLCLGSAMLCLGAATSSRLNGEKKIAESDDEV